MPMDISWAFNGVPIDTSKDTSITITRISKHLSTLIIDGVSARHAGEYACSASNLAGSVSRSTTLTVNGTTPIFLSARFQSYDNRLYSLPTHPCQLPPFVVSPIILAEDYLSTKRTHFPPPCQSHLLVHVALV
ncbi:uncharacterized protein LOC116844732 [Odontomachus brunneus]|uniref:uncharacterized protein LOC116844732 n=1 Tax=Odontomachus brunneus TaxID=486640 RepID=UPI0013F230B0|nr:uncharacterized protein LOC116844732 [Odontomachus brunneus]